MAVGWYQNQKYYNVVSSKSLLFAAVIWMVLHIPTWLFAYHGEDGITYHPNQVRDVTVCQFFGLLYVIAWEKTYCRSYNLNQNKHRISYPSYFNVPKNSICHQYTKGLNISLSISEWTNSPKRHKSRNPKGNASCSQRVWEGEDIWTWVGQLFLVGR